MLSINTKKDAFASSPNERRDQQAYPLDIHPLMKIVYSGTIGIFGAVAANITALTTEQIHANNSAQNLTLLLFQSVLI